NKVGTNLFIIVLFVGIIAGLVVITIFIIVIVVRRRRDFLPIKDKIKDDDDKEEMTDKTEAKDDKSKEVKSNEENGEPTPDHQTSSGSSSSE
ncbi:MAG: hypothetical protein CUN57_03275, partial [Phototrophicales bacterium]